MEGEHFGIALVGEKSKIYLFIYLFTYFLKLYLPLVHKIVFANKFQLYHKIKQNIIHDCRP